MNLKTRLAVFSGLAVCVLAALFLTGLFRPWPALAAPLPAGRMLTDAAPATPDAAPAPTEYALKNPLGSESIPTLVGRAVTIFTGVSGTLALLMFIYGGILWIFSGGNDERVKKGKDVMKWAIIGLVVMFTAYALVRVLFQGIGATSTPAVTTK